MLLDDDGRRQDMLDGCVLDAVAHVAEADRPVDHDGHFVREQRRVIDEHDGHAGGHEDADAFARNLLDGGFENHDGEHHLPVGAGAFVLVGEQDAVGEFRGVLEEGLRDFRALRNFQRDVARLDEPFVRDGAERLDAVALADGGDEHGGDGAEGLRIVDLVAERVLYPQLQFRDHQGVEAEIGAEQIRVMDDLVGGHLVDLGVDGLADVFRNVAGVDLRREILRLRHGARAAFLPPVVGDVEVVGRVVVVEGLQIAVDGLLVAVLREVVRAVDEFDGDVTPRHEEEEVGQQRLEVADDGFDERRLVAFGAAEGGAPEAACADEHDADFRIQFEDALHAAVGAEVF